MLSLLFLSAVALTDRPAPTPAEPIVCADTAWRNHFPDPALVCVEARYGEVIAPAQDAQMLADFIDVAAERFAHYFGSPAKPVVLVSGGGISPEQNRFLHRDGVILMPWISAEQRAELIRSSVRAQLSRRYPDYGPEQLDAAVERSVSSAQRSSASREGGTLPHELGHLWFRELLGSPHSSGETPSATRRYGSAAPDWLDELAAVLCEDAELTSARRAQLPAVVAESGDAGLFPLTDFLTMEHPMLQSAIAGADNAEPGASRVVVVTGAPAQGVSAAASFYVQTRAFADFLLETSGNPRIFLSIAEAIGSGESFEAWLAHEGAAYKLPATMAKLDTAWQAWLARNR